MNPWQGLTSAPISLAPYKAPKQPRPVRFSYLDARASNPWGLTATQLKVLEILSETGNNKAVARKLGMALKTAEEHVREMTRKMGVDNRTLAVVAYVRWKLAD